MFCYCIGFAFVLAMYFEKLTIAQSTDTTPTSSPSKAASTTNHTPEHIILYLKNPFSK